MLHSAVSVRHSHPVRPFPLNEEGRFKAQGTDSMVCSEIKTCTRPTSQFKKRIYIIQALLICENSAHLTPHQKYQVHHQLHWDIWKKSSMLHCFIYGIAVHCCFANLLPKKKKGNPTGRQSRAVFERPLLTTWITKVS